MSSSGIFALSCLFLIFKSYALFAGEILINHIYIENQNTLHKKKKTVNKLLPCKYGWSERKKYTLQIIKSFYKNHYEI